MTDPQQPDLFLVGRKSNRKAILPRDRDLVFDAIAVACGFDPGAIGKRNAERVGIAAAELRAEGVTATRADYDVVLAVGVQYERDLPKLCVGGYPTPLGLSSHYHALVRKVKPSVKATSDAAAAKATKERMERENKAWWPKRLAIIQAIVAEADAAEVERIWQNLRTSMRLPKKATMDMHLGKIADLVAPGELARRMTTDTQE